MGSIDQPIDLPKVLSDCNIKNFVETGTGHGYSIHKLLSIGHPDLTIYTIELLDILFNTVSAAFLDEPSVNLVHGPSHIEIGKVVKEISSEPTLFWHDAHFPGADFQIGDATYTSEPDVTKRIPLESELRAIKNSDRDTSCDVFVIDDLRVYKDGVCPEGPWPFRAEAGGDGIEFVHELFAETHHIFELHIVQGFIIMFPKTMDMAACRALIMGDPILEESR